MPSLLPAPIVSSCGLSHRTCNTRLTSNGALTYRTQAADLGLIFSALGSYYCPGRHPSYDGHPVTEENQLAAAQALGAPIIRIWPGTVARQATEPAVRERLYAEIRDFADDASDAGILVTLERHVGSLTEGWDAPLTVLSEIDHPGVTLNYQVVYPASTEELATRAVPDYWRLLPYSSTRTSAELRYRPG